MLLELLDIREGGFDWIGDVIVTMLELVGSDDRWAVACWSGCAASTGFGELIVANRGWWDEWEQLTRTHDRLLDMALTM